MNYRLGACLQLAVVFIFGVGRPAKADPLIERASSDDTKQVQTSLAEGSDVNAKNNFGKPALTFAKKKGHKEIEIMLKQAGAKE